MKKRFLAVFLSVVLLLGMLPFSAQAEDLTDYYKDTETLNGGTKSVSAPIQLNYKTVYFVMKDTTVNNNGENKLGDLSAIEVPDYSESVLYIKEGVTLTVNGHDAIKGNGGGAGIRVPEHATLIITGGGTLVANGGNAASLGFVPVGHGENGTPAKGGNGGNGGDGGGGAGAGIGGRGGNGGAGGLGGVGGTSGSRKGKDGKNGADGDPGELCGTIYVLGGTVVSAMSGSFAYASSESGRRGEYQSLGGLAINLVEGGGGGGTGGPGETARQSGIGPGNYPIGIGSGGSGGGGGGGGGGGSFQPGDGPGIGAFPGGGVSGEGAGMRAGSGGVSGSTPNSTKGGKGGISVRYATKVTPFTETPDVMKYQTSIDAYGSFGSSTVNVVLGEAPAPIVLTAQPPKVEKLVGFAVYGKDDIVINADGTWVKDTAYVDAKGRWICLNGVTFITKTDPTTYEINRDLAGGLLDTGDTDAPIAAVYNSAVSVREPVSLTRLHEFNGWYLKGNADYSEAQYSTDGGESWTEIRDSTQLCTVGESPIIFKNLTALDGGSVTLEAAWKFTSLAQYGIHVSASTLRDDMVSGGGIWFEGDTATVRAIEKDNYRFVRWTEGTYRLQLTTDKELFFTVTRDRYLTAIFEPIPTKTETITVIPNVGDPFEIPWEADDSVPDIKEKIGQATGYDAEQLTLSHYGTTLLNVGSVDIYNIGGGTTVQLTVPQSAAPTAATATVSKAATVQAQVAFTLTNDPPPAGEWKVYADSAAAHIHKTVTATVTGSTLTLSDGSGDIRPGTYYVSVKETGKAESMCLALTVMPFVPPVTEDLVITGGTPDTDYTYSDGVLTVTGAGIYEVKMKEGISSSCNRIIIDAGGDVQMNLNGVYLTALQGQPALQIMHCAVTLTASAPSALTGGAGADRATESGENGYEGIYGTFEFAGGTLTVQGGRGGDSHHYAAAKDGGNGGCGIAGNVRVLGGTLTVLGGPGGDSVSDSAAAVLATGGAGGHGTAGDVTVLGGVFASTGGDGGSGVASYGNGKAVSGTVTADPAGFIIGAGDHAEATLTELVSPAQTTVKYINVIRNSKPLYLVTVNGSYAADNGAGLYTAGSHVSIDAGEREGYTFRGWTSSGAVPADAAQASTTFIMPQGDVTVEAGWSPILPANPFSDVKENDWFYEDVLLAYGSRLIYGTSPTTFSPSGITTRGMCVTLLYRLDGSPAMTEGCPFDDVNPGSYYETAIIWAAETGVVSGYGNRRFGPDDNITREQMAAVLYRYASFRGYDTEASADLTTFTDYGEISDYAETALSWAYAGRLIYGQGSGILNPGGFAQRCEVAAILRRFCNRISA